MEDFNYSRCPDEKYKREWITKYLTYYLERNPAEDEVDNLVNGSNAFEAVNLMFCLQINNEVRFLNEVKNN